MIRTSVPAATLGPEDAVRTYKCLAHVEQAFRSLKSVDLKVRPIHHRLEERVRAHVPLCMLAYYVEWHMRQALEPLLFDDEDPAAAEPLRPSVVAPAQRSPSAQRKALTKLTADDAAMHSFETLTSDLRPSRETASCPPPRTRWPLTSSPLPPSCSSAPSICSASITECSQ